MKKLLMLSMFVSTVAFTGYENIMMHSDNVKILVTLLTDLCIAEEYIPNMKKLIQKRTGESPFCIVKRSSEKMFRLLGQFNAEELSGEAFEKEVSNISSNIPLLVTNYEGRLGVAFPKAKKDKE